MTIFFEMYEHFVLLISRRGVENLSLPFKYFSFETCLIHLHIRTWLALIFYDAVTRDWCRTLISPVRFSDPSSFLNHYSHYFLYGLHTRVIFTLWASSSCAFPSPTLSNAYLTFCFCQSVRYGWRILLLHLRHHLLLPRQRQVHSWPESCLWSRAQVVPRRHGRHQTRCVSERTCNSFWMSNCMAEYIIYSQMI